MKVLWLSNTAASGAEVLKFGGLGGGWLASLDQAIAPFVDLHIAFEYPKRAESFVHQGITYHPICNENWKLYLLLAQFGIEPPVDQKRKAYLDLIHKIAPDLIHIHGTENLFGLVQNDIKTPVLISIQGNLTVYAHKYSHGLGERMIGKRWFKPKGWFFPSWFPTFASALRDYNRKKLVEQEVLKNSKWIMGRTHWDKRISKVLAPKAIYLHGDEMLRPLFYNSIWSPPSEKTPFIIHSTTGGNPYKGFETMAEALSLLLHLGLKVTWQVAGLTSTDLLVEAVKVKMGAKFPSEGFVFLGGLNAPDLIRHMQRAHMYVMPSHIENSPNNLCEAMILGMPVLATNAGGTSSLLRDGMEGLLIQDGDPWVMAGAIKELMEDYSVAIDLGKQARTRALQRHHGDAIVRQMLKAYELLIQHAN